MLARVLVARTGGRKGIRKNQAVKTGSGGRLPPWAHTVANAVFSARDAT